MLFSVLALYFVPALGRRLCRGARLALGQRRCDVAPQGLLRADVLATTERALRAAVRRRSEAAAATAAKKKKSKNKNKKRKSKKERNGNGDGDQGEDEIDEADGAEEDATEDFQDAVMVVPSAVSDELCDLIVELFDATEGWAGYPGNFLREGAGVVVETYSFSGQFSIMACSPVVGQSPH